MVVGKRNMTKNRIYALIITTVVVIIIMLMADAITPEVSAGTNPATFNQVSVNTQVPDTTTTSTIDLSFLNTTTTTDSSHAISAAPTEQPSVAGSDKWDLLAQCEAGGNWATNTGNGFGGGLQFMHGSGYSTWLSFGGGEFAGHPWEATREQQIVVAERVLASSGWGAWPGCSSKLGMR